MVVQSRHPRLSTGAVQLDGGEEVEVTSEKGGASGFKSGRRGEG